MNAVMQPHLSSTLRTLPCLNSAPFMRTSAFVSLRAFVHSSRRFRTSFASSAAVLDRPSTSAAGEGFDQLGLGPELVTAVEEQGLNSPTEIQARFIPSLHWIRKRQCASAFAEPRRNKELPPQCDYRAWLKLPS